MKMLQNLLVATLTTVAMNAFAGDCPPLSGRFTIGTSANADFSSFTEAVNALQCGGVSSAVTFTVESGVYKEKVIISSIPGASVFNTVSFESKTGNREDVVIAYAATDAAVILNGTNHLTFENLTIDHQNGTYGNSVRVDGKSGNLIFKGVVFEGIREERTGADNATVYFSNTAPKSAVTFEDCEINNGSIGIYKSGMSAAQMDAQTTITGTLFFNQYESGITLVNENAPEISNNVVSSLSTYPLYHGISLSEVNNNVVVTNNIINAANGSVGIAMNNCIATEAAYAQVNNNSIAVGGTGQAIGISLSGNTDNQVLNFNRIKLTINGEQAANQAYYKNSGTGNNVNLLNNIFYDLHAGSYTILGNTYKDLNNRLPAQSTAELSVSANGIMVEKVYPIK